MDNDIRTTLDGDLNVHDNPGPYILEDAHDDVLEPMSGKFLPDVDDVEQTDGYNEFVGAQMVFDLGGENGLRGTVI
jgi:hypothetical protein